ncbi:MAG: hypothetical protein WAO16_25630, partial [Pseudolabrys sp.]
YIQRHPAIAPRRTRQPRTKYERCATSEACVRFETLAASEQSGLETCASVLLYSRYHLAHGNGGMRGGKPNR